MNRNTIKKFAFTLAETLLTMAIIGVVMALMLRSISRVNPDKDKVLFIKSYHSIEAAVANIISDASKYDQNTDTNSDFSSLPLPTAYATINGTVYCTSEWKADSSTGVSCSKPDITQSNALCYFLAEQINHLGEPNCGSSADVPNFKTTNGVCFYNWESFGTDFIEGVVDPRCKGEGGYKIKVFKDGKMTVDKGADGSAQRDAFDWINDQTQIKN